jgi:hypothetical protein
MKKATANYIREEQRRFGAKPRIKAVIQGAGLAVPIEIDEADIIECGNLIASRPAYFHDVHGETHTLTLDNRGHRWQPGHANFLIPDGIWYGREIHIYTGFDLPGGGTEWILQYVGRIRDFWDISDSFTGKHQAKIYSNLLIHEILETVIGAPATDGTRQPFMAGYYRCRAELKETVDPYVSPVTKVGIGTASLVVTGDFHNTEDINFVVQAESTGEIGTATIRWSVDYGNSWQKSGIASMTSINPLKLQDGVAIYFTLAAGTDLVAWDWFSFTAYAKRTKFVIPGAPFLEISNVYLNGLEVFDSTPNITTGELAVTGSSGLVDARVVKSETYNPIDIIEEILAPVGLSSYIDTVSFSNARRDLMDLEIGVRFEAAAAWKAIQAVCSTCLIYFWIDANKIFVSAYTGES